MIIVVDANILLSGVINPYGNISKLFIRQNSSIEFIIPEFALTEINLHKEKICRKSKITFSHFDDLLERFLENITVFSNDIVAIELYRQARELTSKIDTNDAWYIAFAIAFKGLVWTGDLKLHRALRKRKFYQTITTQEFSAILEGI